MSLKAPPGKPSIPDDDPSSADVFFQLPEALDAACIAAWRQIVADPARSRSLAAGVFGASRDKLDQAWAGLCVAYHQIRGGALDDASDALRRARELFGDLRDARGEALGSVTGAYFDIVRGDTARALEALERVIESYAKSKRIAPLDHFLAYHAIALAHGRQGNLEAALQHHYANLLLLEQCGSPSPLAVVLLNLSSTLMAIDDWEESLGLALRAVLLLRAVRQRDSQAPRRGERRPRLPVSRQARRSPRVAGKASRGAVSGSPAAISRSTSTRRRR